MGLASGITTLIESRTPRAFRRDVYDHLGNVIGQEVRVVTPPAAVVSTTGGRRRDRRAAARRKDTNMDTYGGRPSKGTPKDGRLKENRPPPPKPKGKP